MISFFISISSDSGHCGHSNKEPKWIPESYGPHAGLPSPPQPANLSSRTGPPVVCLHMAESEDPKYVNLLTYTCTCTRTIDLFKQNLAKFLQRSLRSQTLKTKIHLLKMHQRLTHGIWNCKCIKISLHSSQNFIDKSIVSKISINFDRWNEVSRVSAKEDAYRYCHQCPYTDSVQGSALPGLWQGSFPRPCVEVAACSLSTWRLCMQKGTLNVCRFVCVYIIDQTFFKWH